MAQFSGFLNWIIRINKGNYRKTGDRLDIVHSVLGVQLTETIPLR